MHLKRISLKGFKSFADRVEMTFEPGVGVIVGPNGSGKSNIVDALMWVMSSAPPSGIRAETGQDALFLGSGAKPAAQHCEVEIVLDNADGRVEIPYQELAIKRRLERGGESTYMINGNVVRRIDILELLADTGIGKDMHSIIGQGKVDRMLSAKPADRRSAIEEAAGLGKYKRRRRRTQQKLDRVRLDIDRVRDIEREMESRLRPLKTQANAAQRYSTVLAERWTMTLLLHKDDVRRAGAELRGANERRDESRKRVFAAEKAATDLRAERDQADRKIAQVMREAEAARQLLQRMSSVRERLRIRHQGFVDRGSSMRRSAAGAQARREFAVGEVERCRRELDAVTTRLGEVTGRIDVLTGQQHEVLQQIASIEQLFADERAAVRQLAELEGRASALTERRQGIVVRANRLAADAETLAAQRVEAARTLEQATVSARQADEVVGQATTARDAAEQAHADAAVALDTARTAADQARTAVARLEERTAMGEARVELLDQRLEAAAADQGDHGFPRLADAFDVKPGYERALAAALADDADALVVPDRSGLIEFACRVAGASVRAFVAGSGQAAGGSETLPGTAIGDLVTVHGPASANLARRLDRVRVVDDIETAARALINPTGNILLVTREGVAFDPVNLRVWSVGDSSVVDRFQMQNERDRAAEELEQIAAELGVARQALDAAQATTGKAVEALAAARDHLAGAQRRLSEAQAHAAREHARLGGVTREHDDLVAREQRITDERAEVQQALEQATGDDTALASDLKAARKQHEQLAQRVEVAREEEAVAREAAAARNAELAGLASERQALERDDRRLRAAVEQYGRDIAEAGEQAVRFEALERVAVRAAVAVQRAVDTLAQDGGLSDRAQAGERQLEKVDRLRRELSEREQKVLAEVASARNELTTAEVLVAQAIERMQVAQDNVENTLHEYREHVEQAREMLERARAEAGTTESAEDGEEDDADAITIDVHNIDTDEEVELEPAERDRIAAQVAKLARRLDLMGPINPLAAREYDDQKVRHEDLVRQRKDLEGAARELELMISDLDQTLVARFNETFEAVSHHFEESIKALFPGGTGRLKLVQLTPAAVAEAIEGDGEAAGDAAIAEDEVPDPGVEIDVRPAGKPAGRLGLLSGGEKSLVALAFLFSLFLARPSPFYMLDEVEAALDDANIVRFLSLLERYRTQAQFIVITHQVRTMEAADVLYGVTMEHNSGVSSVVARRPAGKRSAVFERGAGDASDRETSPV